MLGFVQSLSVVGWLLIALALATLWQLPAILRMIFFRHREGRRPIPGEDPPHLTGVSARPDDDQN